MGRCPAPQREPYSSLDRAKSVSDLTTKLVNPQSVNVLWSSINTQAPAKLHKDFKSNKTLGLHDQQYSTFQKNYDSIKAYQTSSKVYADPNAQTYGQCPDTMVFGVSASKENSAFCYDTCMPGYEPVSYCSNGSPSCSQDLLVYACRALCPSKNEGLGPWAEVNQDPLFGCKYLYPQDKVPADPNLWESCPDDGRYFVLQSSPTDVAKAAADRKEPMCVRKEYLRQITCPIGYNQDGLKCIASCDANEVIVTLPSGTVVCQSPTPVNSSNRHEMDLAALADSHNSKREFRHRTLTRKNMTRGLGSDPNVGIPGPPETLGVTATKAGFAVGGAGLFIFLFIFLTKK
jgi:hypothetical protein